MKVFAAPSQFSSTSLLETCATNGGLRSKTYPLLGELSCALVLGVSEQFDDTALVGGETGDFADDVTHERGALAEVALGAGDAGRWLDRGDLLLWLSAILNPSLHLQSF